MKLINKNFFLEFEPAVFKQNGDGKTGDLQAKKVLRFRHLSSNKNLSINCNQMLLKNG